MLTVIIGASGSGKSVFAEDYLCQKRSQKREGKLLYIATMEPFGEEVLKKISRHKEQRAGKGFISVEQYKAIEQTKLVDTQTFVLLECLSNLVANEMYEDGEIYTEVSSKIVDGLRILEKKCAHLVLVTNDVFSEGKISWEGAEDYLRELGHINQKLVQMADFVYQIVAGLPILRSGRELESMKKTEKPEGAEKARSIEEIKGMLEVKNAEKRNKEKRDSAFLPQILIIGGAYQGKTKWAMEQYHIEPYEVVDCRKQMLLKQESRLIIHFEQWIIQWLENKGRREEQLKENKLKQRQSKLDSVLIDCCWKEAQKLWIDQKNYIVIVDEIGSGMVPMEKKQRMEREFVGRITCRLAQEAEQVYQIMAGLSMRLK